MAVLAASQLMLGTRLAKEERKKEDNESQSFQVGHLRIVSGHSYF